MTALERIIERYREASDRRAELAAETAARRRLLDLARVWRWQRLALSGPGYPNFRVEGKVGWQTFARDARLATVVLAIGVLRDALEGRGDE